MRLLIIGFVLFLNSCGPSHTLGTSQLLTAQKAPVTSYCNFKSSGGAYAPSFYDSTFHFYAANVTGDTGVNHMLENQAAFIHLMQGADSSAQHSPAFWGLQESGFAGLCDADSVAYSNKGGNK